MSKILVVKDDFDLSNIIRDFLKNEGHEVRQVHNGLEGLREAKEYGAELLILDIMLPGMDGMAICEEIRTYSYAPIIMISAKNSDMDKMLSFGKGADDYLTKPFSMIELIARVRSHLRRYTSFETLAGAPSDGEGEKKVYEDITIDQMAMKVTAFDREISLTAKEFKVLDFLSDHPGRVFSKEQIMDHVWGFNEFLDDNTVAVYIGRVREKLAKAGVGYIKTVWGMGYKWEK